MFRLRPASDCLAASHNHFFVMPRRYRITQGLTLRSLPLTASTNCFRPGHPALCCCSSINETPELAPRRPGTYCTTALSQVFRCCARDWTDIWLVLLDRSWFVLLRATLPSFLSGLVHAAEEHGLVPRASNTSQLSTATSSLLKTALSNYPA
ncbi:hypothetical protein LY78DRAFT_391786 [Colletotrichum sublineola]|nr:hypothetical protein LY78DRAFT_391786 [Colletotrichum sublineola]